jgi:undecaprenyl-diphosphatase
MNTMQGILLGVVQGITEFLPVSSSGHLVLFQKLFGLSEGVLSFDIALHMATLLALAWVFRRDLLAMIAHPFSKLTLLVVVGTIPTAIIGFALKDLVEGLFESGRTLGFEFIATGMALLAAEAIAKNRGPGKGIEAVSYLDASIVGVAQGLAILPAVSRSGLTLAGALSRGIDREAALRLSFIMSIPPILGASLLDIKDVVEAGGAAASGMPLLPLAAGMAAAAISGYAAIRFMLKVFSKASLKAFAYYVFALGIGVIAEQLAGGSSSGRYQS